MVQITCSKDCLRDEDEEEVDEVVCTGLDSCKSEKSGEWERVRRGGGREKGRALDQYQCCSHSTSG